MASKKIKIITGGVNSKANPVLSLHEQILSFFTMRQGITESDNEYLTRFNSRHKTLELAGGGHIFCSSEILGKTIHDATDMEMKIEKERFLAMCFLMRSDKSRYGELIEDLKKGVFRERDEYPTTVIAAYELLIRTSKQIGFVQRRIPRQASRFRNGRSNFSFAQRGNQPIIENVVGTDGVTHAHITCFN